MEHSLPPLPNKGGGGGPIRSDLKRVCFASWVVVELVGEEA